MNARLEKIISEIDRSMMRDSPEPDYSKMDDVDYGDIVAIEWAGEFEGMVDYGYVMGLPGVEEADANIGGIIHVPCPSNPGGRDAAGPEWITVYSVGTHFGIKRMRRVSSMREHAA